MTAGIESTLNEWADMSDANEPRTAELTQVTLARMEGKLDNVVERVSDLRADVSGHGIRINTLESTTQQLASDMRGAEEARTLAAAAVKAADEARVAAAKAQVDNSTQQWSPVMKLYATLGAFAAIVTAWYYITHPHG